MLGLGFQELLIIMVLVVGLGITLASRSKPVRITGSALALTSFRLNQSGAGGEYVVIVGRQSGFVAWMLTAVGFDTQTTFRVTDQGIAIAATSLFGQFHQFAPFRCVSSTHCGYSKPFGFLLGGGLFAVLAVLNVLTSGMHRISTTSLVLALIAIVLLLVYWFSRKLLLSCETNGGSTLGVVFKPSLIEGQSFTLEQALQVVEIINKKSHAPE